MTAGSEAVHYVGERYQELARLLYAWGYDLVPVSYWDERGIADPLTGLIRITGVKRIDDVRLAFAITENWEAGELADRETRRGASLTLYHYHGSASSGVGVRFCLFEEGHADMPHHWHPSGGTEAEPHEPIDVREALERFEIQVFAEHGGELED